MFLGDDLVGQPITLRADCLCNGMGLLGRRAQRVRLMDIGKRLGAFRLDFNLFGLDRKQAIETRRGFRR
jgi:hypothetical protein